jgi:hypothetical protein
VNIRTPSDHVREGWALKKAEYVIRLGIKGKSWSCDNTWIVRLQCEEQNNKIILFVDML